MFKLLDKLMEHWTKKMQKNAWYFLIELGEIFAFALALLGLSKLIAFYLAKNTLFSSYSYMDLIIFGFFAFIIIIIGLAHSNHEFKEDKKAKERLANRQISDYVEKYQKYVDLVENVLHTEVCFKDVHLVKDWVKQFDRHLTNIARLCQNQKRDFTDFELATCLMYALTSRDSSSLHIDFAFQCAKSIINYPAVYYCNYLDGGELDLDVEKTYNYIDDFSALTPEQDAFALSLLDCYLSQRDYDQFFKLADFLEVLYIYCEQLQ